MGTKTDLTTPILVPFTFLSLIPPVVLVAAPFLHEAAPSPAFLPGSLRKKYQPGGVKKKKKILYTNFKVVSCSQDITTSFCFPALYTDNMLTVRVCHTCRRADCMAPGVSWGGFIY